MILPLQSALRSAIAEAVVQLYQLDRATLPPINIDVPPRRALGDLAVTLAFELARRLRKAPRAIAQEIIAALPPIDGIVRAEAAPNGYINVFLDRPALLRKALAPAIAAGASAAGSSAAGAGGSSSGRSGASSGGPVETVEAAAPDAGAGPLVDSSIPRVKTIVEHTAINPNKAAHIGHLRNATLGDTLVRLLRFSGVPVEVQNYIDDTGVQVADVVVGFRELEGKSLDEIRAIADSTRFDYYCWDLYARVTEWYAGDKARLQVRGETLHAVEHGGNEVAEIAAFIADRIVRAHLKTMGRMNVDYDLLTWEGDILRLKFWATAFDILRDSGQMYLQTAGKLAGCWVMKIEDEPGAAATPAEVAAEAAPAAGGGDTGEAGDAGDTAADADEAKEDEQKEKVIVRSNGTVTYVGKDIAYQFWKFGLLGKDFNYRRFGTKLTGGTLWATTTNGADANQDGRPTFGKAGMTYNVIDTRQAYLQKLLKQALATLGHQRESERSTHFSYEMVALSHRTARELGYADFDESKPFVEVSGRKGLGVKADDLLDRLIEKAHAEVQTRNADMPADVSRRTAEAIAVAAVRYFLVKFTRTKIIAFDIDEALSFEGESGPYLQYSAVRANNIFLKLQEREGLSEQALLDRLAASPAAPLADGEEGDDLWDLVLQAARLDEVVEQAVRTLEPSVVAKYAFSLAQMFNGLYHKVPVLKEERAEWRLWRAAAISYYRSQLTQALNLMGADVPARM
jgi:arginyl-tRNA synthetase